MCSVVALIGSYFEDAPRAVHELRTATSKTLARWNGRIIRDLFEPASPKLQLADEEDVEDKEANDLEGDAEQDVDSPNNNFSSNSPSGKEIKEVQKVAAGGGG